MAVVKKYRGSTTVFKKVLNAQWPGAPLKPDIHKVNDGSSTDATQLLLSYALPEVNNLAAGESITVIIQAYEVEE